MKNIGHSAKDEIYTTFDYAEKNFFFQVNPNYLSYPKIRGLPLNAINTLNCSC